MTRPDIREAGPVSSDADAVVIDHEFKSHESVFWPAAYGAKMFEYRRDDCGGYEIGQTVRLRLWHGDTGYADVPPINRRITNILRGGEFELPAGYCILGLAPLSAALAAPAPAVPDEVRRLSEAATPGTLYTVDQPWGDGTWIVAGNPDPHAGFGVADCAGAFDRESERADAPEAIREVSAADDAAFLAAAWNHVRTLLAATPSGRAGDESDSLGGYLARQMAWSKAAFADRSSAKGLTKHIEKECAEIRANPRDLVEWIDVVMLALDGYWRHGGTPADVMATLEGKLAKNMAREWPVSANPDEPNEHDRSDDAIPPASAGAVPEGWRLVPDEATGEMWQAGREADAHPGDSYSAVWDAMLAAAPTAPEPPAGGDRETAPVTKAECVALAGTIRREFGKLADAYGDAYDIDDACDRVVDTVLGFLAARELPRSILSTPSAAQTAAGGDGLSLIAETTPIKGFPNRAGQSDADDEIAAELEAAGIDRHRLELLRSKGEVKTAVYGDLHGWSFKRAWRYWVAEGPGIELAAADILHAAHPATVRVDGHCGCPSPREWFNGLAVGCYHVDSPAGLKGLADTIRYLVARTEPPATPANAGEA